MTSVGCAYASGDAETRDDCTCPVCEASRYYRPMADAIAASQAETRAAHETRESRMADPLSAATLDRDVALAAARDAEEHAVATAAAIRARAEENAEKFYLSACKRVAVTVETQRADVSRYADMDDDDLVESLRMETFRLSRTHGRMRADIRVETAVKVDAMRAELERRCVEIPRWRFQDRAVTS